MAACGAALFMAISIHAPHARSDALRAAMSARSAYFNPRSSCEERLDCFGCPVNPFLFQSTLLMRGATKAGWRAYRQTGISIHAPHARSDRSALTRLRLYRSFQSTLLMRGATGHFIAQADIVLVFQSTLLMRGATRRMGPVHSDHHISIHAPHARSDLAAARAGTPMLYFNPRSSCEERRVTRTRTRQTTTHFNPRSSCEERLAIRFTTTSSHTISIHAPHARSDQLNTAYDAFVKQFQSTLLMRGATCNLRCFGICLRFISIHAPHARSDVMTSFASLCSKYYFNPRSSCEERLHCSS